MAQFTTSFPTLQIRQEAFELFEDKTKDNKLYRAVFDSIQGVANVFRETHKTLNDMIGGGDATILSGTTAIVITHSMSFTPIAQDINFILTENPTNDIGNMWVSSITATQFTLNCRNDPGASNLDISWQVIKTS